MIQNECYPLLVALRWSVRGTYLWCHTEARPPAPPSERTDHHNSTSRHHRCHTTAQHKHTHEHLSRTNFLFVTHVDRRALTVNAVCTRDSGLLNPETAETLRQICLRSTVSSCKQTNKHIYYVFIHACFRHHAYINHDHHLWVKWADLHCHLSVGQSQKWGQMIRCHHGTASRVTAVNHSVHHRLHASVAETAEDKKAMIYECYAWFHTGDVWEWYPCRRSSLRVSWAGDSRGSETFPSFFTGKRPSIT